MSLVRSFGHVKRACARAWRCVRGQGSKLRGEEMR